MKHHLATIAALIGITLPAYAQQYTEYKLLPALYANTFCAVRKAGASHEDAIKAGIEASMIRERGEMIIINGKPVPANVAAATQMALSRCPEVF